MSKKRRRDTDVDLSQYIRLLGSTASLGRTTGILRGTPRCTVVRSWNTNGGGICKNEFNHVYNVSDFGVTDEPSTLRTLRVCDCDAMAGLRGVVDATPPASRSSVRMTGTGCSHLDALTRLGLRAIDTTPIDEYGPVAVLNVMDATALSVADSGAPSTFNRVIVNVDAANRRYACANKSCKTYKSACSHVKIVEQTVVDHELQDVHPFSAVLAMASETSGPASSGADGSVDGPEPLGPKDPEGATIPPPPPPPPPAESPPVRIPLNSYPPRALMRSASLNAASQWLPLGRVCVPCADGECAACKVPWSQAMLVCVEKGGRLFGTAETLAVEVYARRCACGVVKPYDGVEDAVFVYSTKILWLYETLLPYVDLMVESRMPFNAYYKVLERQHERRGPSALCSRDTCIESIKAFLRALDVDYDHLFTCPVCSALPYKEQVYIIDGKAMGFRKDTMKAMPVTTPRHTTDDAEEYAALIKTTQFYYISGSSSAVQLAKLVQDYGSGHDVDFAAMRNGCKKYALELVDVLDFIKREHPNPVPCPPAFRTFLFDVASPYPASDYIHASLRVQVGGTASVMDRILDGEEIVQADRARLLHWSSLSTLVSGRAKVPDAFKPLLKRLLHLARLPDSFVADAASVANVCTATTTTTTTTRGLSEDPMSFFPNHPKIRNARVYDVNANEPSCTKHVLKPTRWTPGMFGVFCPHGICVGFEAMRQYESARIPFKIFYERFPAAPGTIVYDNACNASRYFLRREPLFFAHTLSLIDRLHQTGHIRCHNGYRINAYPKDMPILGGQMTIGKLNSQAAEQAHAKMKLIETQTSFMSQDTFMDYCKLFLALTNQTIQKKMNDRA
jgi:hypothetical protein